jgi:phospholipid/cholesterol/gamma-HCH transport system ATP-binding protein
VIRLAGVKKSFRSPVLYDIDFHVPEACLYGIVGPGAAGKSVLLKLFAGLLRPDAGTVTVSGTELTRLGELELSRVRATMGMLFQNNALFDFMTVAENVAFPLRRLLQLEETEIESRVTERLRTVGLPGFEQRLPGGLSGGQRKRVGIARATVTRPPILLYDEPAAGLDPVSSQKIFELLRREQLATRATVVVISSDVPRLLQITDRVAMLLDGRLLFDGTTEDALASREPRVHQFIHGKPEGPL